MQDSFIIRQHMSVFEYYAAAMYLGVRSKRWRYFYYYIIGMAAILTVVNFFALHDQPVQIAVNVLLLLSAPIIFFAVFGLLISWLLLLFKPSLARNITYEFNHWGLIKKTQAAEHSAEYSAEHSAEHSSPWRSILKWKETKQFIFLYVTKDVAHVIQKRMFTGADELDDFRRLLSEKVNTAE